MKPVQALVYLVLCASVSKVWSQAKLPIFRDEGATVKDRAWDLVGRMTLDEKIAQLQSLNQVPGRNQPSFNLFCNKRLDQNAARRLLKNGLGTYAFMDEFGGVADSPQQEVARRNELQKWVIANTRLGIPILFHGEALHGAVTRGATSFPQAIALGSTWDPELLEQVYGAIASEARALGNALVLAPVLDLSRDPRFGRVEEMYSEDPFLTARLGIAAIRGLQGNEEHIDENHVVAVAKHFVHGQPENGTNTGPSDFSQHTLRQVFLYPFQQAVQVAHVGAVMSSYNENRGGIPSTGDSWLLKDVLRKEWRFGGAVVSDYDAVEQLWSVHHVAKSREDAGVLAISSGVDVELPTPSGYSALASAVGKGLVSEQLIDEAVARVLEIKFRTGLFEHPYIDPVRADRIVGSETHATLARKAADESIILLKNAGSILPLDPDRIKTLAVIGPNGDKIRLGDYSGDPPYFTTVLEGIRKRVPKGTRVLFAEGCRISEPDNSRAANNFIPFRPSSEQSDRELIRQAVEVAGKADVVVLALGGNEAVSGESLGEIPNASPSYRDTDTLDLPGRQGELAAQIARLGKPIVAVLLNGRPYSMETLDRSTSAIVEGWYLGQETGSAIAGVLFGDVNPSGRLPVSIARNVGQLPVYYYKKPSSRRGYYSGPNTPQYPFGYGLSYTKFGYGYPILDKKVITSHDTAHLRVRVTNSGGRSGDEIVQMYIHHGTSSVVQPVLLLRGFRRIHLEPGQEATVTFDIGHAELTIINAREQEVVEPGTIEIRVGPSSAETNSVELTVLD